MCRYTRVVDPTVETYGGKGAEALEPFLPVTGSDVLWLGVVGVALVAFGALWAYEWYRAQG